MISLYFALCVILGVETSECSSDTPIAPYSSSYVPNPPPVEPVVEVADSVYAQISAYTAIETCGATCVMASGKSAYIGAAACPRSVALGTVVDIEDYGSVVCEDRTAGWTEGRYDIFFGYSEADYQRALQWGVRNKKITIN